MAIAKDMIDNKFSGANQMQITNFIYWGVQSIDNEDTGLWDPEDIGKVQFDKDFSLSSIEAQKSILSLCEDLKNQDFVLDQQVNCLLKDNFDPWLRSPTQAA